MTAKRPITEDDLQSYVDAALDSLRRQEVEDHLDGHPDVARRIAGYARQREDLRAALGPIAEEPLPPELNFARMIEARPRARFAPWRAAAACLLLFAAVGGGWSLHGIVEPSPQGISALAREAADSYAVYAPDRSRPVEIRAAEQAELVQWASQRLSRSVAVPDLSGSGYRFMGGRLVATAHGPAVLFMYDDDHGTRLIVLSRRMEIDRDTPMSQHSNGAVDGFSWVGGGIGYSLVGPLPADRLHPIADEVRRQVEKGT
jgi:anti-sigma factor RsiW